MCTSSNTWFLGPRVSASHANLGVSIGSFAFASLTGVLSLQTYRQTHCYAAPSVATGRIYAWMWPKMAPKQQTLG